MWWMATWYGWQVVGGWRQKLENQLSLFIGAGSQLLVQVHYFDPNSTTLLVVKSFHPEISRKVGLGQSGPRVQGA